MRRSLVWYSPKYFADNGYTVPTTWADLMSLSAKMASKMTGTAKPWCGGISSGTASGWPATDWLEEVVLGSFGGQVYDDWISHKVTFSSPQIQQAMKTVAGWLQNPAWVNGGAGNVKTIATTTFQNAGLPILKNQCGMLQQALFYEAQWPKGTKVGPDGAVFAFKLPAVDPAVAAGDRLVRDLPVPLGVERPAGRQDVRRDKSRLAARHGADADAPGELRVASGPHRTRGASSRSSSRSSCS
jgi:alpha-glucoside transport system substrate-binding protein